MYTKKLFLLVALLMIISSAVFAQYTETAWTGNQGGGGNNRWDLAGNWDNFSVPGPTNNVTIGSTSYNPAITSASTCHDLTISSGGILNLSSTPGVTLYVTGNLLIDANARIEGNVGCIVVTGNWVRTLGASPSTRGDFFFGTSSTVILNPPVGVTTSMTPTVFFNFEKAGAGTLNLSGDMSVGSKLTISGGKLNAASYNINIGGLEANPFVITAGPGAFVQGTSTVLYKGSGSTANILTGITYNNLTVNAGNGVCSFTAAGAMTVNSLSVLAGELKLDASTYIVQGDISVATGGTAIFTANAASTIILNGNSLQHIAPVTYAGLVADNLQNVELSPSSASTCYIGGLTVNRGTFSDKGQQIYLGTSGNTLVMAANTNLKLGFGSNVTYSPFDNSVPSVSLDPTSTIQYIATSAQTVTSFSSYQNVILDGSLKKFNGSATFLGKLTITASASVTIPNGNTISISGANAWLSNAGTITLSGILDINGGVGKIHALGTINGDQAATSLLSFSYSGAQTVNMGSLNTVGTVTFNTNTVFNLAPTTIPSAATVTLANAALVVPNSAWTIGILTLSGTSVLSVPDGVTITDNGNLNVGNGTTITTAGTGKVLVKGATCTFNATGNLNGFGLFEFNPTVGNGTMTVNSNVANYGTLTLNSSSKTVTTSGTPGTLNNVAVSGSKAVILASGSTLNLDGNLTFTGTPTFNLNTSTMNIKGSITEVAGSSFLLGSTGIIVFNGTTAQTWTLGAAKDYNGIAITLNKAGNLYLDNSLKIGDVTFTTATPINMGGATNCLTLRGLTGDGFSGAAGYIYSGTVAHTVAQVAYTFPVGGPSSISTLSITSAGTDPGVTTVGYVDQWATSAPFVYEFAGSPVVTVKRVAPFYYTLQVANALIGNTNTLQVNKVFKDAFQPPADARLMISEDAGSPVWLGTGTNTGYLNVGTGSSSVDWSITYVKVTNVGPISSTTKKIAYGLASAIVDLVGKVYYGDLAAIDANAIGGTTTNGGQGIGVNLYCATPAVSKMAWVTTAAHTFTFASVEGITTTNYELKVTQPPVWSKLIAGPASTDAVEIRNYVVGRVAFQPSNACTMRKRAADVNQDGVIDGRDAMKIMQKAVDPIGQVWLQDWAASTVQVGPTLTASVTGIVLRLIAMGDAAYSGVPSIPKALPFANAGNVNVDAKKAFSVPVQLVSGDIETAAFTMALKYPADKVEYKGVVSSIEGLIAYASNGYVRMMWIDMSAKKTLKIAKDAEIASIKFQPKEGFNANSGFDLELSAENTSFSDNDAQTINLSLNSPHVGMIMPKEFELSQNYPNPFNPATTMDYSVPEVGSRVSIKVYNIIGQVVATLFDGIQEPGRYNVQWDARNLSSGVYIVRMTGSSATKDYSKVVKLMLLK